MARPREKYWYALKVFFNRVEMLREVFKASRYETFVPMLLERPDGGGKPVEKPAVPSLLFVKCSEQFLTDLKHDRWDVFMCYPDTEGHPGKISDHDMEVFMKATSAPLQGGEFLGSDTQNYMVGEKVRVKEGVYKGYEGYIKRIKHDRKLLVCLEGIAVIAFSNIKMENVEKIDI
ncbi:MAG: UpxY family transcription antiterminator [Bacteroidales bacterium]|nr:UpxY family transcription antiterminator [Bacteroidales bacterium]